MYVCMYVYMYMYVCMYVGMLSGAYYGVISPEGAASILGRYKDDQHKLKQFPLDCQVLPVLLVVVVLY